MEQDETGQFDLFHTNTQDTVSAQLILLAEKGRCELTYRGDKIESIGFTDFFVLKIHDEYRQLDRSIEEPFPNEAACNLEIPSQFVRVLDVKGDFVNSLGDTMSDKAIIRILFQGDLKSIIITGQLFKKRLLIYCLQRIQDFLNSKNNVNYVFRKLAPVLKQSEQALIDTLNKIRNSPLQMVEQILKPSEQTFPFWAQLSNSVIKELKDKKDKLPREISQCQAAYLVGYYNIYYRDQVHKNRERAAALGSLGDRLKKEPYAFSLGDIMNFKDGKTVLLDNKYSRKDLSQYIEEKTKIKDDELLPEIVRLKAGDKREYYVHRDIITTLFYKKITDAHDFYRKKYLDEWEENLRDYKKTPPMLEDKAFHDDLESRLNREDPLLMVLMNYDLLYLVIKQNPQSSMSREAEKHLDLKQKDLKKIEEILDLKRKDLYAQAMRGLPFWRSLPLLGPILEFFFRLSAQSKKNKWNKAQKKAQKAENDLAVNGDDDSGGPGEQKRRENFRRHILDLKEEVLGSGASIETMLTDLAEKWNPLYDEVAKKNLIEDVNSLVRDYLRSIKRGLLASPPDRQRIKNLAEILIKNKGLEKIKKKDILEKYLEIYILYVLQHTKFF